MWGEGAIQGRKLEERKKGTVGKERKQKQGDMLITELSHDKKLQAAWSPGQGYIEPTMAQNSLPIFCLPQVEVHPWALHPLHFWGDQPISMGSSWRSCCPPPSTLLHLSPGTGGQGRASVVQVESGLSADAAGLQGSRSYGSSAAGFAPRKEVAAIAASPPRSKQPRAQEAGRRALLGRCIIWVPSTCLWATCIIFCYSRWFWNSMCTCIYTSIYKWGKKTSGKLLYQNVNSGYHRSMTTFYLSSFLFICILHIQRNNKLFEKKKKSPHIKRCSESQAWTCESWRNQHFYIPFPIVTSSFSLSLLLVYKQKATVLYKGALLSGRDVFLQKTWVWTAYLPTLDHMISTNPDLSFLICKLGVIMNVTCRIVLRSQGYNLHQDSEEATMYCLHIKQYLKVARQIRSSRWGKYRFGI